LQNCAGQLGGTESQFSSHHASVTTLGCRLWHLPPGAGAGVGDGGGGVGDGGTGPGVGAGAGVGGLGPIGGMNPLQRAAFAPSTCLQIACATCVVGGVGSGSHAMSGLNSVSGELSTAHTAT
jgi:hypothetical protein